MNLRKILRTGSTLAFAAVTIASPLTALKALSSPIADQVPDRAEIAQISEPPPASAPTPTPAAPRPATPAPTPAPTAPAPAAPAPAAPTPPAAAPAPESAPRADVPGLFERVEYINACRQTNRSVEVFTDTALSPVNRIGTLAANAQVSLTGVLAPGRAQVIRRESPNGAILLVGWINSAYLTSCGGAPSPEKVCYRVNVPSLILRSGPSSTSSYQGTLSSGSIVYATTAPPTEQTSPGTPPDNGRIWVQVFVRNNIVWIARTGPNGVGNNATQLSGAECSQ